MAKIHKLFLLWWWSTGSPVSPVDKLLLHHALRQILPSGQQHKTAPAPVWTPQLIPLITFCQNGMRRCAVLFQIQCERAFRKHKKINCWCYIWWVMRQLGCFLWSDDRDKLPGGVTFRQFHIACLWAWNCLKSLKKVGNSLLFQNTPQNTHSVTVERKYISFKSVWQCTSHWRWQVILHYLKT